MDFDADSERSELDSVARLAVPAFADACVIELVEPFTLEVVAKDFADPLLIAELTDRVGAAVAVAGGAPEPRVIATGDALGSMLVVPVSALGRPVGAVAFALTSKRRGYARADLDFATRVARLAAMPVARTLRRARSSAMHLAPHELREPLAAIELQLELLHRESVPELNDRQQLAVRRIGSAVRRLTEVVNTALGSEVELPEAHEAVEYSPVSGRPPLVLIVDDAAEIREDLADLLRDEGYDVDAIGNPIEALRRLERYGVLPDVILLDLMMPDGGGQRFREEQLARPALARIPVVLLSATADVQGAAGAMGVTAYLTKPFDLDALLLVLRRMCREPDAMAH
jgi:CheY-like chemotaxis protein